MAIMWMALLVARSRAGIAGGLKPDKDEVYGNEQDGEPYAPEVRARAVRMVLEHQGSSETQAAAIAAIAPKIGCIPGTLKAWVRQVERDTGVRDGATSEERDRIKALEREVRETRQVEPWKRSPLSRHRSERRWRRSE